MPIKLNTVSFVGANYVARELNYSLAGEPSSYWGEAERATQAAFRPISAFEGKFAALLRDVKALGFGAMDLWLAHLHPDWASCEHIELAKSLLEHHEVRVTSLAGSFGRTQEQFEACCKLAAELNVPLLAGPTPFCQTDKGTTVAILQTYGIKLGVENHPEKTPGEMLKVIEDGKGVIGTALDTGWYGTQGYDAAQAFEELAEHVYAVHLKDVCKVGSHLTCRFGDGVVPLERCVLAMKRLDYRGGIAIEHEPPNYNPEAEIRENLKLVKGWLA